MIDPLYPIVDSMPVCATCAHELIHSVHMGPVRRDVTAQNYCLANLRLDYTNYSFSNDRRKIRFDKVK